MRNPYIRKGNSIHQHLINTRNSLFGNTLVEGVNPESWLNPIPEIRPNLCQAEKPWSRRDRDGVPNLDRGAHGTSLASWIELNWIWYLFLVYRFLFGTIQCTKYYRLCFLLKQSRKLVPKYIVKIMVIFIALFWCL